jgi:uncharacterized protein (DUF58 family)
LQISFPLSPSRQNSRAEGDIITLGYPALFHWTSLVVLGGFFIFAALQHITPLLTVTACVMALVLPARLWSRYALRGLTAVISLDRDRAFPGEKIELTLELTNRGLPLPWLEIEMELPYRLITGRNPSSPYTWKRPRWLTALSRGQAVAWRHTIECSARGEYTLGPLRVRSGDFFGLFSREMVIPRFVKVLVYPRLYSLEKLPVPLRALYGEKVAPRSVYDDTSRVAGARDYRPGDPFKHIHWKASAAHFQLQTRQYESSTSLSLLLILDAHSYPEESEAFERAVSTVASLAYEADRQGFSVGLDINSSPAVYLPIGTGRDHLVQALEALARLTAGSPTPLHEQLDRLRTVLPLGVSLVAVTNEPAAALSGLTSCLEREGHSLLCVSTGTDTVPANIPAKGGLS